MAPDRERRAKELFLAVRERTPSERDAALETACGDDRDLLAYVLQLLTAANEADPGSSLRHWGVPRDPVHAQLVGQRVGVYHIQRLIAEGGMGVVYEAEQDNPRRRVALKLLNRRRLSEAAVRRFAMEPQVLAGLSHPGIAQIYEAGGICVDGEDVPYYAMELVHGACSVTDFATRRSLDVRQTLELFARVCDAVHHGHQRGVIHRDLKPDNILVDADGNPKVIDFGVARVLNAGITPDTMHTRDGQVLGTFGYMSPEQCTGRLDDVGVRSDVYSLGVIAYELLCGRPPYDLGGRTIPSAIQAITALHPQRPRAVRPGMPLDLEAILLKALAKNPEVRYGSAEELAADLRRHLAGRRVTARQRTTFLRLVDHIRDHPVRATTAVCGLIVVLAVALTFISVRILGSRPYRAVVAPTGDAAVLESLSGRTLARWPGGTRFATLVSSPGGNHSLRLVVVGFSDSADGRPLQPPLGRFSRCDFVGRPPAP